MEHQRRPLLLLGTVIITASLTLTPAVASGPTISLVSQSSGGDQADYFSSEGVVTPDGRYVAFTSSATTLVADDDNTMLDVFVRDTVSGTTERVSVSSTGDQSNKNSQFPVISDDGRYVAFVSGASTLVNDATNGSNVYLHDRQSGQTELISVSTAGVPGDRGSGTSTIDMSPDGRFIAFASNATNFSARDTNSGIDVYLRDRSREVTRLVSRKRSGAAAGKSRYPSVSNNGRFIAYETGSRRVVRDDENGTTDFVVRDRQKHKNELVTVSTSGKQANGETFTTPSISANGRLVAFTSLASNLSRADGDRQPDVFVRNRAAETTRLVSDPGVDAAPPSFGSLGPSISADGAFIAFTSYEVLAPEDLNGEWRDAYLWSRSSGETSLVSAPIGGIHAEALSEATGISADGRYVVFGSGADNLVADDFNTTADLFLLDRTG